MPRLSIKKFDSISEKEADKIVDSLIEVLKESKITYGDAHAILENTRIKLCKMSEYLHL